MIAGTPTKASTSGPVSSTPVSEAATVSDRSKSQQEMELTISQLSEQRDRLVKQLAEARASKFTL